MFLDPAQQLLVEQRVKAAQENPQAFATLYDQFIDPIYRFLLARLGNQAEAEDLAARTFLTAYEKLHTYSHRGSFQAWLFRIARNYYIDHLRHAGVESVYQPQLLSDTEPDPPEISFKRERQAALQKAFASLEPEEQELLQLRFSAELPFADIAEILNKSEAGVKKTTYRLLARLRQNLEDYHE